MTVESARGVERLCGVRPDVVELPLGEFQLENRYWVKLTASIVWSDLGSTMVTEAGGRVDWLSSSLVSWLFIC